MSPEVSISSLTELINYPPPIGGYRGGGRVVQNLRLKLYGNVTSSFKAKRESYDVRTRETYISLREKEVSIHMLICTYL